MKYAFIFAFLYVIQINAQIFNCPTRLDETSVISNDFRQASMFALGVNFDGANPDPYYNGDGSTPLFDLGFTKGVWATGIGADGIPKILASLYGIASDFGSGPIFNNPEDPQGLCEYYRRVWTIKASEISRFKQKIASGNISAADVSKDILEWPAIGNPHIGEFAPDYEMAPFFDNDGDGLYNPLEGDHPLSLQESPTFVPSQFRFYVFNDNALHSQSNGFPILMEFHIVDYVVDCAESITSESEQAIFTRMKYIYKGEEDLTDFNIAIWEDGDLGCYEDDRLGCYPDLNASYVYNQDDTDRLGCGSAQSMPSNLGAIRNLVFLNQKLESFTFYIGFTGLGVPASGFQTPVNYFNLLNGKWITGEDVTVGGTGYNPSSSDVTNYVFPDLPNQTDGWSMASTMFPGHNARSVSVFDKAPLIQTGFSETVDFVDYLIVDRDKIGLAVFEDYVEKINSVKQDFESMKDGSFACGFLSSVESDAPEQDFLKLIPNPAAEFLDITLSEALDGTMSIHTMQGTLVESIELKEASNIRLDLSAYASANYLVTVISEIGVFSQRFTKCKH